MREEARRRIELYNQRIAEIAGRYNLLVVDAYSVTHEVIPSHPEFFSEDGFHPSDVGYEYWAKTMWPTVKAAIGE
jgi:lysophospholipase L1-like esterase